MTTTKVIAAGYERAYFGIVDATLGIHKGDTVGSGTAADGFPMVRLDGVKTANVQIKEPESVFISGDDGPIGAFIFPNEETPKFDLITAVNDLGAVALYSGTKVYADGDINVGVLQPDSPTFPDVSLVLMRRAISRDAGATLGLTRWEGVIIPRATIIPAGSEGLEQKKGGQYKYSVICNFSSTLPHGRAVTATNFGTTAAPIFPFTADNRIHFQTFISDGIITDFNLSKTPASSVITTKNRIIVNGTIQAAGVTVNTSTKVVHFTSAPAAGYVAVMYEHV
jgi:hypothetical protein